MDNKQIQIVLKNRGYYTGAIDGIIGNISKGAIKRFQQDYSLVVDGIAGLKTQAKLMIINGVHKARNIQLSPHFNEREFVCKDGTNDVLINPSLVAKLEQLRVKIGKPININSGFRNPAHNRAVGGVSNSPHLLGNACDICVNGMKATTLCEQAHSIGLYVILYPTFVHVEPR